MSILELKCSSHLTRYMGEMLMQEQDQVAAHLIYCSCEILCWPQSLSSV